MQQHNILRSRHVDAGGDSRRALPPPPPPPPSSPTRVSTSIFPRDVRLRGRQRRVVETRMIVRPSGSERDHERIETLERALICMVETLRCAKQHAFRCSRELDATRLRLVTVEERLLLNNASVAALDARTSRLEQGELAVDEQVCDVERMLDDLGDDVLSRLEALEQAESSPSPPPPPQPPTIEHTRAEACATKRRRRVCDTKGRKRASHAKDNCV